MSSSWLLDIFGDSDLRSSTKLRHTGNVKSVVFLKEKQTTPSLCSIVNLPILHPLGFREHWQHCFFFLCSDLCCSFPPAEGGELSISSLSCCAFSFGSSSFCLQLLVCCRFQGSRAALACQDHLCCRKVGSSSLSWSCCINQKCPHSEAGSVPHFTQFPANWCKLHFESMLIHRNSTNWEGLTKGRGI